MNFCRMSRTQQCSYCNHDACDVPHADRQLYHGPFSLQKLNLNHLIEQNRGMVLCSEDVNKVYAGVQTSACKPILSRANIRHVWVDIKGRLWIVASGSAVPIQVPERNMFTTQTHKQQHAEYIIRCIKDSAAWERGHSTHRSICEVTSLIAEKFGDSKIYTKRTVQKRPSGATIKCVHVFHDVSRGPGCATCKRFWLNCEIYTFLGILLGVNVSHKPTLLHS